MIKLQRILKLRTALTQAMGTAAEEQNKQLIRQFFETFDRQDTERIGQLVSSSNYSLHISGMPPMDWNETKQFSAAFYSAFPDLRHNIVDMVAEGDKVAIRLNVTGTHKGELQGIPPTGKQVSFTAMDFITLMDGKVAEEWVNADIMGLMQQIGAIPVPPPAS
jgi:steroid delta-isomerase-like uncharacterized protein